MIEDCFKEENNKNNSGKKYKAKLTQLESFSGMENFCEISDDEPKDKVMPKKKKAKGFNLNQKKYISKLH